MLKIAECSEHKHHLKLSRLGGLTQVDEFRSLEDIGFLFFSCYPTRQIVLAFG